MMPTSSRDTKVGGYLGKGGGASGFGCREGRHEVELGPDLSLAARGALPLRCPSAWLSGQLFMIGFSSHEFRDKEQSCGCVERVTL